MAGGHPSRVRASMGPPYEAMDTMPSAAERTTGDMSIRTRVWLAVAL
jgi:hypothetical protein